MTIGSNWFSGVQFPLVIGNRYVHIGYAETGSTQPLVRVFHWDTETQVTKEELPVQEAGQLLTFGPKGDAGAIRLDVSDPQSIRGYIALGGDAALTVIISRNSLQLLRGDSVIANMANNVVAGSAIGLRIDPATGGVTLGGQLPEGFRLGFEQTLVEGEEIRIAGLVSPQEPILANQLFVECRILGPAVLARVGPIEITQCRFDTLGAGPESLVWDIPGDRKPLGAILLMNVGFRQCSFVGVALAARPDERDEFLSGFNRNQ